MMRKICTYWRTSSVNGHSFTSLRCIAFLLCVAARQHQTAQRIELCFVNVCWRMPLTVTQPVWSISCMPECCFSVFHHKCRDEQVIGLYVFLSALLVAVFV